MNAALLDAQLTETCKAWGRCRELLRQARVMIESSGAVTGAPSLERKRALLAAIKTELDGRK